MELAFKLGLCAAMGLLPAYVAHNKGRNFLVWWFLGSALFILVMPVALLLKPMGFGPRRGATAPPAPQDAAPPQDVYEKRPCPHCAEPIRLEAKFCRFCHLEVPPAA